MPEPEPRDALVASGSIDDELLTPAPQLPVAPGGDDTGPIEQDIRGSDLIPTPEEVDDSTAPSEPSALRRRLVAFREALFDPDRRWLGYVRAGLTVAGLLVMLWVLVWALGALFDAVGELLDSFQRSTEETIESLGTPSGG